MSQNQTKQTHDKIQADIKEYMQNSSNSMFDFAIAKAIESGNNSISELSRKWRIPLETMRNSLNASLFKVDNDKIDLA